MMMMVRRRSTMGDRERTSHQAFSWTILAVAVMLLGSAAATTTTTTSLQAGFCEDIFYSLPIEHDLPGQMTVFGVEFIAKQGKGGKMAYAFNFLANIEDSVFGSYYGLASLNPAVINSDISIEIVGMANTRARCSPVLKACDSWTSAMTLSCPLDEKVVAALPRQVEVQMVSDPEPSNAVETRIKVCLEDRVALPSTLPLQSDPRPTSTSRGGAGAAALPTVGICVRPFRPYFYKTKTRSITDEQVQQWIAHHVKQGVDRLYLYDRYEDGSSSESPTLNNIIASLDDPLVTARRDQVISVYSMPYFTALNATFDSLVTQSYIIDQVYTMEMCFMRARQEGIDYVFHIDFDEFLHYKAGPELPSLKHALAETLRYCDKCGRGISESDRQTASGPYHGIVVPRWALENAHFDISRPVEWALDPSRKFQPDDSFDSSELTCNDYASPYFFDYDNKKTAFSMKVVNASTGFTVHEPCFVPDQLCYATFDIIWMDHLVDAYSVRSTSLHPPKAHLMLSAGSWIIKGLGLIAAVLTIVIVASFITRAHVRNQRLYRPASKTDPKSSCEDAASPKAWYQIFSAACLPKSKIENASPYSARLSIPIKFIPKFLLVGTKNSGSRGLKTAAFGCLLLVCGALVFDTSSQTKVMESRLLTSNAGLFKNLRGVRFNSNIYLGPMSSMEMKTLPDNKLEISSYYWEPEDPARGLVIKLQGDVDIVAFASCGWDSKFKMLTCKSEPLSIPHLPGTTQSLQIFESHRNPYPSNNDVWRYDERLLTKVVDTNIKIFDVSNKERCGQEPSRKIQPTDSVSHVSFPLSNSVFCSSPESEFEMNGGIWVSGRICRPSNKKGGASESLSSFVHNQLSYSDDDIADACANAFYTPPRHAWGTYLSWGSLVDCLTDSFAENASPPSGQDYVYLPKLHRRDTQKSFEYMPKLAERLSQSWVHLTGDSVMFLEFMAIYQLFVQGNSRAGVPSPLLRCALPLEGKASANQYESFQLCDPLIHLDGTSMKNKTDSDKDGHHKTQEHEWIWMIDDVYHNTVVTYTWESHKEVADFITKQPGLCGGSCRNTFLVYGTGMHNTDSSNVLLRKQTHIRGKEADLLRYVFHDLSVLLRSGHFEYKNAFVHGPVGSALDIQAWGMDADAIKNVGELMRRYAQGRGINYIDSMMTHLPRVFTASGKFMGDYTDNVHFAGRLLWATAHDLLNSLQKVASSASALQDPI